MSNRTESAGPQWGLVPDYFSPAATGYQPFFDAADQVVAPRGFPRYPWTESVRAAGERSLATLLAGVRTLVFHQPRLSVSEDVTEVGGHVVTLKRLRELLDEPEADEYGLARPTPHSYNLAVHLLTGAAQHARSRVPRGSACTDSEGRVRVTWIRGAREIRLIVAASPDEECYLYYEAGDRYGVESINAGEDLAKWLDWLSAER